MNDDEQYELLVKEQLENIDGFIEFDGWNCNDYGDEECEGWDGQEDRCQCGNRRVAWVLSDCKTEVYAEAY